jgi:hypothetical protein
MNKKAENEEHVFNLFHKSKTQNKPIINFKSALYYKTRACKVRDSKTRACGLTYKQKIHL